MRSIKSKLSALRPIKLIISCIRLRLLVFSNAFPALQCTPKPHWSTKHLNKVSQIPDIEKEAQEAVLKDPIHGKKHKLKGVKVSMRSGKMLRK